MSEQGAFVVSSEDVAALAEFRHLVRRYLAFAHAIADARGLTMQQHQALLVVRAAPEGSVCVGDLAGMMFLQHHSAVELSGRLVAANLLQKSRDPGDGRRAILTLTADGASAVEELAAAHLREIAAMGPHLVASLDKIAARAAR